MAFLARARDLGVRNFEMEAQAIAYVCKEANVEGGVVWCGVV